MNVLAGMTSGAIASAIANPTDVLKVKDLWLFRTGDEMKTLVLVVVVVRLGCRVRLTRLTRREKAVQSTFSRFTGKKVYMDYTEWVTIVVYIASTMCFCPLYLCLCCREWYQLQTELWWWPGCCFRRTTSSKTSSFAVVTCLTPLSRTYGELLLYSR